ncbi:MAG: DUF4126 domain-containing protein [Anaerolineae bacterium]|nr:MAG: DUF4126 domain-containing protein [Anaerolineae bacterium]
MIEALSSVFTAFGLSSAAGLNAYLPLLIVALLARYTDLITLREPWNALEPWIIGLLVVLLAIEMLADKVAGIDHINDIIQTFIRPVAGAILFAANGNVISDLHVVLALGLGVLAAGSVHTAKATVRPAITVTTAGLGNPVVSVLEDIVSAALTIMAILLPILTVLVIVLMVILVLRWRRKRKMAAQPTSPAAGP